MKYIVPVLSLLVLFQTSLTKASEIILSDEAKKFVTESLKQLPKENLKAGGIDVRFTSPLKRELTEKDLKCLHTQIEDMGELIKDLKKYPHEVLFKKIDFELRGQVHEGESSVKLFHYAFDKNPAIIVSIRSSYDIDKKHCAFADKSEIMKALKLEAAKIEKEVKNANEDEDLLLEE